MLPLEKSINYLSAHSHHEGWLIFWHFRSKESCIKSLCFNIWSYPMRERNNIGCFKKRSSLSQISKKEILLEINFLYSQQTYPYPCCLNQFLIHLFSCQKHSNLFKAFSNASNPKDAPPSSISSNFEQSASFKSEWKLSLSENYLRIHFASRKYIQVSKCRIA